MAALNRLLCLLAVAALAAPACDYFRPVDPEPPSGQTIRPDYSDPDATLLTMTLGIADKGHTNGASVYAGALADSTTAATPAFHQFFAPEDELRWESTSGRQAPDWSIVLEQNFYSRFVLLRAEAYVMEWKEDELDPLNDIQAETAALHRQYLVTTESGDTIAIGLAHLQFYRSRGRWLITQWQDVRDVAHVNSFDPEQKSLGLLRLETQ